MSECSNKSSKINCAWTTIQRQSRVDVLSARNSAAFEELKARRGTVPPRLAKLVEDQPKLTAKQHRDMSSNSKTNVSNQMKEKTTLTKRKINKTNPKLNRSKSDLNMLSTTADVVRSKSSSNLKAIANVSPKKKSYNPEEARRFMQEQKKKRRSLSSARSEKENGKSQINPDDIKQRLQNLQRNTQKILNENVNKVRRRKSVEKVKPVENAVSKQVEKLELTKPIVKRKIVFEHNTKNTKSQNDSKEMCISLKPDLPKIGLLRKTEIEDHSFSALDNIEVKNDGRVVNIFTPILTEKLEVDKLDNCHFSKRQLEDKETSVSHKHIERSANTGVNLEVQASKSKSTCFNLKEKSVQVSDAVTKERKTNEIPYWLKPTPVQVYPYNFIMAVRKKLEAITKPAVMASSAKVNCIQEQTPLSHPKQDRITNVKRRIANAKEEQSFDIKNASKNLTEIASNFSSLSIHIPESNTVSDVSSIKSESNYILSSTKVSKNVFNGEKDISIACSENSLPSPLSFEKIDHLKIKSKSVCNSINLNRGDYLELPLNESDRSDLSNGPTPHRDVDFNQFLQDFNKSLSQVIEVNDQLKTTLDKSQLIFSPDRYKNKNKAEKDSDIGSKQTTSDVYTSDFEDPASSAETHATDLENNNDTVLMMQSPNDNIYSTVVRKAISLTSRLSNRTESAAPATKDTYDTINKSSFSDSSNPNLAGVEETFKRSLQSLVEKVERSHSNKCLDEINLKFDTISKGFREDCSVTDNDLINTTETQTILEEVLRIPIQNDKICEKVESPNKMTKVSDPLEVLSPLSDQENLKTSYSGASFVEDGSAIDSDYNRNSSSAESPKIISNKTFTTESLFEEQSISEEIYVSEEKENRSCNQFSKDSLDMNRDDFIESHINRSRGDFSEVLTLDSKKNIEVAERSLGPPGYFADTSKHRNSSPESSLSLSSSFLFNNQSFSESTLNYSSIGMFEQLIQNESTKSEKLMTLLKIREKALIDRTKGQIAWLQVQKDKYKAQGLTIEISSIRKKQRAVLLKMQKEREEIKKLQEKHLTQEKQNSPRKARNPKLAKNFLDFSIRKSCLSPVSSSSIVKGFEVATGKSLEVLLQKREAELVARRAHVERLMEWHKRLDHEEEEVLQLEKMLFNYNAQPQSQSTESDRNVRIEKKLKEIDKSLRELNSISDEAQGVNYVRAGGNQLNKLWRRLTGQKTQKFDESLRFKLRKSDLEKLYEEAKKTVLDDFGKNDMNDFLDRSSFSTASQLSVVIVNGTTIPKLNLNISPGQSECNYQNLCSLSLKSNDSEDKTDSFAQNESSLKNSSENLNTSSSVPPSDVISLADTAVEISSEMLSKKASTEVISYPSYTEPTTDGLTLTIYSNETSKSVSKSTGEIVSNIKSTERDEINISSTNEQSRQISEIIDEIDQPSENFSRENVITSKISSEETDKSRVMQSPTFEDSLESKVSLEELVPSVSTSIIVQHAEPVKISDLDHSSDNNESYENDFESTEGTLLEDISVPKFESTADESRMFDDNSQDQSSRSNKAEQSELEKRLIDLGDSLKGLQTTFERALSPEKSPTQSNISSPRSPEHDKENTIPTKTSTASSSLMPDIISEAELRRRQQIQYENEIKQFENAVPYNMYLREIPNKPPPPYVPPAHGSPMTNIFPSEERIKDITYRRTLELYNAIMKTETTPTNATKPASVLDENITNIYERIILDICKECMNEFGRTLTDRNPEIYKDPLAFYNPPNRAECMQAFVYKRIRKYLAMDKCKPKQQNSVFAIGRRKRDHVDEILIQELFEDEARWTNFDSEEAEVKATIIDEIIIDVVRDVIGELFSSEQPVIGNDYIEGRGQMT